MEVEASILPADEQAQMEAEEVHVAVAEPNQEEEEVLAAVVVDDDDDADDESVSVATEVVAVVDPPKKKKKKRKKSTGSSVRPERLHAAKDAREMLVEEVQTLPHSMGECQIRAFGRLLVDRSPFCTTAALYPVGFTCDRYEFSPSHGRIVKLRCSILNVDNKPLFRIVWGQGIDEDANVEYPFSLKETAPPPAVGMRVRVKFTADKAYEGSITSAVQKTSKSYKLDILYDDGSTEKLVYPDRDVTLVLPGKEEDEKIKGEITTWKGKPVTSAVGRSPLEAWGQVLIKLGLIDEIMLDFAMKTVEKSRDEGHQEAKLRLAGKSPSKLNKKAEDDEETSAADTPQDDKEPPSEREKALRERVEMLLKELEDANQEDQQAAIKLADTRLELLGLCNPFGEAGSKNQQSWLATAVRKEKTRMGSTGNRKKMVSAVDLLERNDSLSGPDVESLIEGLPGSEFCKSYVFHAFRGINRSWIHEAQIAQERESRRKRSRDALEKEQNRVDMERTKKRRKKEEVRDAKKRQRLEEEEEKKRSRMDERLSRLRVQVDERLFKEASVQREKVVASLVRSLAKEFSRRRKAAELVSSQTVVDSNSKKGEEMNEMVASDLPPISKVYDEDAIRVWNFVSTFRGFFLEREYVSEIPTLDSLQDAVDCLRGGKTSTSLSKDDAIASLTELAMALCKPLAASLTRVLFASLIALNPVLQKDFGAAFFNEVNANPSAEGESNNSGADMLLPVNSMTWQEIARLTFLADALGELGYSRHEAAHILRGYRSAGHPNSKEARRLRKAEEFTVALLRQTINESRLPSRQSNRPSVVRACVPCRPLCDPTDFRFFLHNINSMDEATPSDLQRNLVDAIQCLKREAGYEEVCKKLEELRSLVDKHPSTDTQSPAKTEAKVPKKVKDSAKRLLDEVADMASDKYAEKAARGALDERHDWRHLDTNGEVARQQMGLIDKLLLTAGEYKNASHTREKYMEDALRLKEELEREKRKDDEDDDDDDDDDASRAEVVANGDHKEENGEETEVQSDTEEGSKREDASVNPKGEDIKNNKPGPHKADEEDNPVIEGESARKDNGNFMTAKPHKTDVSEPSLSADAASDSSRDFLKIGKETPYDEFCSDIPDAPETIRRCLAVLRTVCVSNCSEPFLYPVDPQSNPAYYDSLVHPMCLREVGKQLRDAACKCKNDEVTQTQFIEDTVAQFARNVRLIGHNCLSYANAGPMVISAGAELLRIFERLLLDWVLAPEGHLPPLEDLDDDRCVLHHPSDAESTVLLCDGCEGKYNIARLDPPLREIPKGDWYCPRCVRGRWWGDLDPRIGKKVRIDKSATEPVGVEVTFKKCLSHFPEGANSKPSLMYVVNYDSGKEEIWPLAKVDNVLAANGICVPKIACLEAVAHSTGYGFGVDHGLRQDLVPIPANPKVSDAACQVALSSSVFRDTIAASGTLLVIDPRDMTAEEWLRLLVLLAMKCAASDVLQSVVSKMEADCAEKMSLSFEKLGKMSKIIDVIPAIDDSDSRDDPAEVDSVAISDGEMATSESVKGDEKSNGDADSSGPTVVEAKSVEVVDEMDIETSQPKGAGTPSVPGRPPETPAVQVVSDVTVPPPARPKPFEAALIQKRRRQKVTEDSFAGYTIKNQIRSSVASFEEDTFSPLVDSCFSAKGSPLGFNSLRCRRMHCTFCGLTDTALGSPIVRVPSEAEWDTLIPHAARGRRTHLVAELPGGSTGSSDTLVSVKIKIKDDIVSVPLDSAESIKDGGLREFLPRSASGFQDELKFRFESGLPFVTGSLSAHECCAVAAHKARRVSAVQRYKERQAEIIEKQFGMECGRTLEVARDTSGRSFWKFFSDPESLFVCTESDAGASWQRFCDSASVASVIICLERDPCVKDLKEAFPVAAGLVKGGTWSDMLLKKRFPNVSHFVNDDGAKELDEEGQHDILEVEGGFDPYHVGEHVLVESKSGQLLWDAIVTAQSKKKKVDSEGSFLLDGYRVDYNAWGSRFTEWVKPNRVVEPSENNRLLQDERMDEMALAPFGLPAELHNLVAVKYLYVRERARAKDLLPDFARIANVDSQKSSNEKTLALMKAALFAIEASLPVGCIDNRETGPWRRRFSEKWKRMVEYADGPALLLRCTILLEETISPAWIKEDIGHLRSCLPAKWKATGEASPSSLALRVILLDRSIMYETIDRKRFSSRKRRR